jgi:hypothetical protein
MYKKVSWIVKPLQSKLTFSYIKLSTNEFWYVKMISKKKKKFSCFFWLKSEVCLSPCHQRSKKCSSPLCHRGVGMTSLFSQLQLEVWMLCYNIVVFASKWEYFCLPYTWLGGYYNEQGLYQMFSQWHPR